MDNTLSFKNRKLLIIALCAILIFSLIVGWSPLNKLSVVPFEESLTGKMQEVVVVMGATIALGVAVDVLPVINGDQVAGKLFDIASYLMIVLGAIVAMKILLAVSLSFSFGIVIPAACLLAIGGIARGSETVAVLAKKLAIFAVVFVLAIPASVGISLAIDNTFEAERTRLVEEIIQEQEDIDTVSSIIESANDLDSLEDEVSNGNFFNRAGKFFGNIGNSVSEIAANIGGAITGAVSNVLDTAKKSLTDLMLLTVQWIVTGCVVPIVTLIGFGFVTKILFGFDVNPKLGIAARAIREKTSSAMPKKTTD